MSAHDPIEVPVYEASTRRAIAFGVSAVFAITVMLVFATLWWFSGSSNEALATLTAVTGVVGTVTGYYFAKGD